jgi:hypothetical protein
MYRQGDHPQEIPGFG